MNNIDEYTTYIDTLLILLLLIVRGKTMDDINNKIISPVNHRRIQLQGAYNFRDLGGYSTTFKEKTIWGKLFRSDNLAKLTVSDLNKIEKLNIRLVIDLRSKEERTLKPNKLPSNNGIKTANIAIADTNIKISALKKAIFYGKLSDLDLEDVVLFLYKRAISDYQNELKQVFSLLSDPDHYPVLILCNSGKDRTGVVIALVLLALDVPRKTIIEDYMLSKICLQPMIRKLTWTVRMLSLFRADINQLRKLLETRVEYLNATFAAIDSNFGSDKAFFDYLGLKDLNRKLLKKHLCL